MTSLNAFLPDIPEDERIAIAPYLNGFTDEQLRDFARAFKLQRKDERLAFWAALCTGWIGGHHFYFGDVVRGILFLLTGGILLIGNIVDIFRIKQLTIETNAGIARTIIMGMR